MPLDSGGEAPDEYVKGGYEGDLVMNTGWNRMDDVAPQLAALESIEQQMQDSWLSDEAVATACKKQAVPAGSLMPVVLRLKVRLVRRVGSGLDSAPIALAPQ